MMLLGALGTRLGGVCEWCIVHIYVHNIPFYTYIYIYICTSVSGWTVYVLYTCTSACDRAVCIFLCTCF